MSGELTMDQKMDMLREARGLGGTPVSKAGREERARLRDVVRAEMTKEPPLPTPFVQSTTVTKNETKIPEPFERRDRSSGGVSTHPWKVTSNGDTTVTVGPGNIQGFIPKGVESGSHTNLLLPFVSTYIEHVSTDVTVTDTGYIYAKVDLLGADAGLSGAEYDDTGEIALTIYRPTGTITPYFSTSSPSALSPVDEFVHFLLAEVSLDSGVVVVDKQILTHNPIVSLTSNLLLLA